MRDNKEFIFIMIITSMIGCLLILLVLFTHNMRFQRNCDKVFEEYNIEINKLHKK